MLQQAIDFREESDALDALLEPISSMDWQSETQFKRWTIADVIAHLHIGNHLALLSLSDETSFHGFVRKMREASLQPGGHLSFTHAWLGGVQGKVLLATWRDFYSQLADRYTATDAARRVPWVGSAMSARSCITARQMETWAHGQAIFDVLGQTRCETDRIRNIAHLGVNTFAWSFRIHSLAEPEVKPYVRLLAPSCSTWEWGSPGAADSVQGSAVEFCQVVTQVRNIADTTLVVRGAVATRWMSFAQCFAGPPETPPRPGSRYRKS